MSQPERARLTIRRAADPEAAEAFLSGRPLQAVPTHAPVVAAAPALAPVVEVPRVEVAAPVAMSVAAPSALAGRRVHERKDGRRVRRKTVLLVEDLARRVDVFAAANGVDKTAVMHDALERWLAERGAIGGSAEW